MAIDQERFDRLSANYITRIFKVCGKVDYRQAFLDMPGQEELAGDIMKTAMEWLQNPDEREELGEKGWGQFMEAIRASCERYVIQQMHEEDSEKDADPIRYIHGIPEDEYLDDPRHEEARAMKRI